MKNLVNSKLLPINVTYLKNIDWYRSQYTLKKLNHNLNPDNLNVLFKSKHFLIVDKPYDLVIYDYHKTNRSKITLFELIKERFPFYFDPRLTGGFHVLHRLDSVTSGCICIPLNYFSQRIAFEAFSSGYLNVEKHYLALVYGKIKPDQLDENGEFEINVPIGEDLRRLKYSRCAIVDKEGNKNENCIRPEKAITKVKILEYGTYKGNECTKIRLKPITGKRHQLRVHMANYGYPIVGDMCYGVNDFDTYRTMLHSHKLSIKINTNKRKFIKAIAPDPFKSDIDPDWKSVEVVNV